MDMMVLCGGLGTRMQSVTSGQSKLLVEVAPGCSLLEFQIKQWLTQSKIGRFIFLLGHKAAEVDGEIRRIFNGLGIPYGDKYCTITEPEPLGTGGAVKFCLSKGLIDGQFFSVMNGDTVFNEALDSLIISGQSSLTVARVKAPEDYGQVLVDSLGEVTKFVEKANPPVSNLVYAGFSVHKTALLSYALDSMPEVLDLCYDVFPLAIKNARYRSVVMERTYCDIGTPYRYRDFVDRIKNLRVSQEDADH